MQHTNGTSFLSHPLILLAMLLLTSPLVGQTKKPVQVFLLGGQSNMVGVGQVKELVSPYDQPFARIPAWNQAEKKWEPLAPGMMKRKGRFGPEISFGRAIAEAMPKAEIRLIKYAAGGTALYNDWAPTKGKQYQAFMNTAKAALADLNKNGVKYEIAGMLWLQGESDAHENKGAGYEKNMTAFITHMRQQFKTPNMPFLIARVLSHYGGKSGQAKLVRDAQEKVAKDMKHVAWFDTDGLPMFNAGHYNGKGLIEIGKRFAKAYVTLNQ